jgi:hypothetical protein
MNWSEARICSIEEKQLRQKTFVSRPTSEQTVSQFHENTEVELSSSEDGQNTSSPAFTETPAAETIFWTTLLADEASAHDLSKAGGSSLASTAVSREVTKSEPIEVTFLEVISNISSEMKLFHTAHPPAMCSSSSTSSEYTPMLDGNLDSK